MTYPIFTRSNAKQGQNGIKQGPKVCVLISIRPKASGRELLLKRNAKADNDNKKDRRHKEDGR